MPHWETSGIPIVEGRGIAVGRYSRNRSSECRISKKSYAEAAGEGRCLGGFGSIIHQTPLPANCEAEFFPRPPAFLQERRTKRTNSQWGVEFRHNRDEIQGAMVLRASTHSQVRMISVIGIGIPGFRTQRGGASTQAACAMTDSSPRTTRSVIRVILGPLRAGRAGRT